MEKSPSHTQSFEMGTVLISQEVLQSILDHSSVVVQVFSLCLSDILWAFHVKLLAVSALTPCLLLPVKH